MQCHSCGTEVRIEQGFCPKCGTFIGMPGATPPQGGKPKLWLIFSSLLIFIIVITAIPAWFLWKSGILPGAKTSRPIFGRARQPHVPAKLSELHGEGEIYFVPIGTQVVAPELLIQHYKNKYNLTIHLLPALNPEKEAYDPKRKQYIAEDLVEQIQLAYPKIAQDPKAVMIGLTDEDIYAYALGWEFNYTFRTDDHFAIVSTHRMKGAGQVERDLRARRMITKDIAVLYYNLPLSADPESVLYEAFVPDERPDDIWESDIHPEDSVYGLQGDQFCLAFIYSYLEHQLATYHGGMDCSLPNQRNANLEVFRIQPKYTDLSIYKTDFSIASTPPIMLQRVHRPLDKLMNAFGVGTSHSYDRYLHTDDVAKMDKADLIYAGGGRIHFVRTSPGRGSMPGMTFAAKDEDGEYEDAILKKGDKEFTLSLANGESYAYLPCDGKTNCHNYESGYKDAEGNELKYTRGNGQFLTAMASRGGSLNLSYDSKLRIVEIHDNHRHHVVYKYDDAGYLAKVVLEDGTETTYEYSNHGHSLNVSVTDKGKTKITIFSAEMDNANRIVKAVVPQQGVYTFQYEFDGSEVQSVLMTSPEGKKLRIRYDGDSYEAHSEK